MANKKTERVLEKCTVEVQLLRVTGTFTNDDGEVIESTKYLVNVAGADLDITFDKNVKSLLDTFVPFDEVEEQ